MVAALLALTGPGGNLGAFCVSGGAVDAWPISWRIHLGDQQRQIGGGDENDGRGHSMNPKLQAEHPQRM